MGSTSINMIIDFLTKSKFVKENRIFKKIPVEEIGGVIKKILGEAILELEDGAELSDIKKIVKSLKDDEEFSKLVIDLLDKATPFKGWLEELSDIMIEHCYGIVFDLTCMFLDQVIKDKEE